jgi:hypothetical protein
VTHDTIIGALHAGWRRADPSSARQFPHGAQRARPPTAPRWPDSSTWRHLPHRLIQITRGLLSLDGGRPPMVGVGGRS